MAFSKLLIATPPPRSVAWARLESYEGPLTAVLPTEYTLSDVLAAGYVKVDDRAIVQNPTPLFPRTEKFDVDTCILPLAFYVFAFVTPEGVRSPFSEPVRYPGLPGGLPEWLPSADDLASLMFARAKGENDVGTLTWGTRPTAEQVRVLIGMAWQLIAPQVGHDVPANWQPTAREVVKLQTALLMEPGFWPEQQQDAVRDAWEQWQKMLDASLKGLLIGLQRDRDDGDAGDGEPVASNLPLFAFPPPGNLYEQGLGDDYPRFRHWCRP